MSKAWLEIDLKKLEHNYNLIRKIEPNKGILGVIKADAYGCGAVKIAEHLVKLGVQIFGVSCIEEALELRNNGISEEILILSAIPHSEYKLAFENNIQLTISTDEDILYIEGNNFKNPRVQIKVDTGMGRLGFIPQDALKWLNSRKSLSKVSIIGVFTHFSCADLLCEKDYTYKQIELFKPFEEIKDLEYIHSQNTGGILNYHDLCRGNLVRPGILLYGFSNLHRDLQPITALKSRIVHLKTMQEDSYISYGNEGFAPKGTLVATVSVGYADGYSRRFSNCGSMYLNNIPCKVLGKVCMDSTMIAVPPSLEKDVFLGMEVDVLGAKPLLELEKADVSPYEYLLRITKRVERQYKI